MTLPTDSTKPATPDVFDEALDRLSSYSYTDGPGMATHGPMGAEALVCLGYDGLVPRWVEAYKARHEPIDPPGPTGRLDPGDPASWRPALGDPTRLADWRELFIRALDQEPWPDVVGTWTPRLFPGYGGAFTHGLIRTSHAVRALERQFERGSPSPLALRELATALSYWAGTYLELPGRAVLRGDLALDEALHRVPRPDQAWSVIEAAQFTRLGELAGFPEAVAALAPPASVDQALSDLTAAFARTMATRDVNPIGLVHAVTPVAGTRVLLPYLPDEVHAEVFTGLWHVSAALTAGMVPPDARGPGRDADSGTEAGAGREGVHEGEDAAETAGDLAPMTADELAARAAAHQDPHAVKYAAACLSEHSLRPDPHYLRAAQRAIERIPGW